MTADLPPTGRIALLASIAAAALTLSAQRSCNDEVWYRERPSVVWDGSAYTAAWDVSNGSNGAVYVQRFSDASGYKAGPPIFRGGTLRSSAQILTDGDGFIVMFGQGDQPGEGDWHPRRHLVVVQLDRSGKVMGEPHTTPWGVSPDYLWRSPIWTGSQYVIGYSELSRHHRHPDTHGLLYFSRTGKYLNHRLLGGHCGNCAFAAHGSALAVARGRHHGGGSDTIEVEFVNVNTADELSGAITIPNVQFGKPWWQMALVPYQDGWALLYGDDQLVMRVVHFDREQVIHSFALPKDIDPATADLGVNERGLFVTWLRDGKVHMRGVASGTEHTLRAPSTSEATHAVGHDDECAAAWNSGHGKRIHIARARCP